MSGIAILCLPEHLCMSRAQNIPKPVDLVMSSAVLKYGGHPRLTQALLLW